MRGTFAFIAGFLCGWASRSSVDSPQALGVKALGLGYDAKARFGRFLAIERERLEDMLAEVKARYDLPSANNADATLIQVAEEVGATRRQQER